MSEKVTIKVERKKLHLPTIALRGLVVFPNNLVHFEVGREKSIAAVEWAMANNSNVFLVAQKSMDTTEPQQADLFSYGVVAEVKQVLRVSGDLVKVLVEGKYRAKLSALDASGDFLLSEVRPAPVRAGKADDAVETEALLRALKAGFDEYLGMNPRLGKDVVFAIVSSDDPAFLSEYMPANLLFRYEDKQAVMDEGTLNGRLKKLIEDLVEASKASTGSLTVNFQPTDVNVLLSQSAGEYQEKLAARDLTLILTPAEEAPMISADGQLLWRVFENLLSNALKYAMPGTRVYLSCETTDQAVVIAFRNISASPLNISAEELMDRFVRGDASRNTEGSGLGLAIARDLTQLQRGTFALTIDGDLFKATLTFPRCQKTQDPAGK